MPVVLIKCKKFIFKTQNNSDVNDIFGSDTEKINNLGRIIKNILQERDNILQNRNQVIK